MSWTYQQSTGIMTPPKGSAWQGATWTGYSGRDDGFNNPLMQEIQGLGPIPAGIYIIGKAYDDSHLGPCVMHLDPMENTNTFGRSLFRIHGDNAKHNGTASEGCIILSPNVRKIINGSNDKTLTVIS